LRWDLGKTDFMEPNLPPAFLYYNPWPEEKRVKVATVSKESVIYDLMRKEQLQAHGGTLEIKLGPFETRVIEIRP